jgi:hypothetical protein
MGKGWVKASDLHIGDELRHILGQNVVLEKIDQEFGEFSVYNFEVEGLHNYYACDVLVHNCNEAPHAGRILRDEVGSVGTDVGQRIPSQRAMRSTQALDSAGHNIGNLRPAVNLLREHNLPLANRREVVEAFTQNSRVLRLTEDRTVYRYWTEGFNGPRGRWVTSELVENPHANLALPNGGPYQTQRWTIPAGTDVIEGLASPNFGMPGGGGQIYVPNPGVLR